MFLFVILPVCVINKINHTHPSQKTKANKPVGASSVMALIYSCKDSSKDRTRFENTLTPPIHLGWVYFRIQVHHLFYSNFFALALWAYHQEKHSNTYLSPWMDEYTSKEHTEKTAHSQSPVKQNY